MNIARITTPARLGVVLLIVAAIVAAGSVSASGSTPDRRAGYHRTPRHLVLNLVGTGEMYRAKVADIDGDGKKDKAMCFDVDLVDQRRNKKIGTATDCLSNDAEVGDGLTVVGTTYFRTRYGTLVTRGNTTVQPVLNDTVLPTGETITHITGAGATGNSVIRGTRRFAGREGTVRLSGMVDMSQFNGNVGDPIFFNCIFVVDLR